MGSSRYHHLDALRAFAMLLGIVLHGMLSFVDLPIWPAQDIRQNTAAYGFIIDAIHGFRMPLFFLISGFFTMMVWRRRGFGALAKQRAVRILLPLVIGTIVLGPMIFALGKWGGATKARIAEQQTETGIWTAARKGDIEAIEASLASGVNANDRDGFGVSPLGWAALYGQVDAIDVLIELGAEVDSRGSDGSTALHAATFFGRLAAAEALIGHGADVNAPNNNGETPLDSAVMDWNIVLFVAGLLEIDVDLDEIKAGRPTTAEYLRSVGAEPGGKTGATQLKELIQFGAFFPVFHHLWFLYYLLWLSAGFMVVVTITRALKWKVAPSWVISAPGCLIWLIPLTFAAQFMMTQAFGPDTAAGIIPWPPTMIYYAIFFAYGALCHGHENWVQRTGRLWPVWFGIAIVALVFGRHAFEQRSTNFQPFHSVASLAAAIYVWGMIFAMLGVFRRWFDTENKVIRYVSDASYWLYLTHLPVIMALQILVSDLPYPSYLKLFFVCVAPTAVLMVFYAWFVRYSFIGTMLNGKRLREGAP